MASIGFIGLGHMGYPMVKNLLKNNHTVRVFDIDPTAVERSVGEGATAALSPAEMATHVEVLITMLQTGDQVEQVCLSEKGVFAHFKKPGALFIDSSSIDIVSSRKLHDAAQSSEIAMIDAPVSGGVAAAVSASLTFMVGGEAVDYERSTSILNAMGEKIIHAGSAGNGVAAKMCNNMLLAISMIGVSETFVLAEKLGLEAKKLFEISSNASGECWSLTHYCPAPGVMPNVPANRDYEPGFMAKMMLKDLKLSQDAAKSVDLLTPLGGHATKLYEQFVSEGNAEVDFSGIIKMLGRE